MIEFPDYEWWRDNVVWPKDSKRFFKRQFYEYYLQKYMIARMFRPAAIAEIGVRWGYSAFSFLTASPGASYLGYDNQSGDYGGAGIKTFRRVRELLGDNFPQAVIMLREIDTRRSDGLEGRYDFIHVDGNHKQSVVEHDMAIALRAAMPGGAILVDDYDYIAGVKRAVDGFVKNNKSAIARYFHLPSLTGEFVMIKGRE